MDRIGSVIHKCYFSECLYFCYVLNHRSFGWGQTGDFEAENDSWHSSVDLKLTISAISEFMLPIQKRNVSKPK